MQKILVSSITPGTTLWYECYSERGELLLTPGTIIMQHHLDNLRKRNIFELYLLTPSSPKLHAALKEREKKEAAPPPPPSSVEPPAVQKKETHDRRPFAEEFERLRTEQIDKLLQSPPARQLDFSLRRGRHLDRPVGVSLRTAIHPASPFSRSRQYKTEICALYGSSLELLKDFLETLFSGRAVDIAPLRKAADRLLKVFIEDPDIIITLTSTSPRDDDYLYRHMLNTCILSLCIAASSGYNREQVLTICIGALLHDIGMPLVPREIRDKNGVLSPREFLEIQKHPVVGVLMLDKIRHLPDPIRYMLYQSHERENGSGYPRHRDSRLIHRYAKIIQIADVYEALTSPRKHRGAYTPFESMEMIIRMGQKGLLARHFVKSFLEYTSLFPIGSIVELSDHRLARVIHANPAMVHRPMVSIIRTEDNKVLDEGDIYQLDLSFDERIAIVRALPPDYLADIDLMRGF